MAFSPEIAPPERFRLRHGSKFMTVMATTMPYVGHG
jgi:hypothetical protein